MLKVLRGERGAHIDLEPWKRQERLIMLGLLPKNKSLKKVGGTSGVCEEGKRKAMEEAGKIRVTMITIEAWKMRKRREITVMIFAFEFSFSFFFEENQMRHHRYYNY